MSHLRGCLQGMVTHITYKNNNGDWIEPKDVEKGWGFKRQKQSEVTTGKIEKMSKSKKNVVVK